jgi:dTDP-6-deoxy-L-talose 4-dehydrogenase (NAD+)
MTGKLSVAVTGGSGFVGGAVLRALLERGAEVAAVTRDGSRLANFQSEVRILEGDISAPSAGLLDVLAGHDVLVHLAWDGLPNYRSLHHFETELPKQYRFLRELVARGLRSLVVTGTCFEYGMQNGELSESLPCMPNNAYGYAKDSLRRQLAFLQEQKPFHLTWARLFYMYGRGQGPKSIYSLLSAAVERRDADFDMSGGEQLRDYLPIEKVAEYLVRLSSQQHDAGIVNVCSGVPRSLRGIVEKWLSENNWEIGIRLGRYPYPNYEPFAFWGSARKLHSLLKIIETTHAEAGAVP